MRNIAKKILFLFLTLTFSVSFSACDLLKISQGEEATSNVTQTSDAIQDTNQITKKTPEVKIEKIEKTQIKNTLSYIGMVLPSEEVVISARTEGVVNNIYVKEGDFVKKDDIIVDLSSTDDTNMTHLAYQISKNNLDNAKSLLEKFKKVTEENIKMAKISLETSEQQLQDAKKTLELTISNNKLNLSTAEEHLQDSKNALNRLKHRLELTKQQLNTNNQNIIDASNMSIDNVYNAIELNLFSTLPSMIITLDGVSDLPTGLNRIKDDIDDLQDDFDDIRKNDIDKLTDILEDMHELILDFTDFLNKIEPNEPGYTTASSIRPSLNAMEQQIQGQNANLIATKNSFNALNINYQSQLQVVLDQVDALEEQISLQEIALNNAKIQIDLSEHTLNTNINLLTKSVESKNIQLKLTQLQNDIEIENRNNQIETLEYQFKQASLQDNYLKIKALSDGRISSINIEKGEVVYPRTPIAKIFRSNKKEIVISVKPEDLVNFTTTTYVDISLKNDNTIYHGEISKINPTADPKSHLVEITISIDNAPKVFIPNSITTVKIPLNLPITDIYIPLKSVFIRESGNFVFIVKNGIAEKTAIEIGDIYDSKVQVKSGLKVGDLLITDGNRNLEDGEKVITSYE